MEAGSKDLQESLMKVGEKIYASNPETAQTSENPEAPKSDDAQDVASEPKA